MRKVRFRDDGDMWSMDTNTSLAWFKPHLLSLYHPAKIWPFRDGDHREMAPLELGTSC